jgi:hypothetical protein
MNEYLLAEHIEINPLNALPIYLQVRSRDNRIITYLQVRSRDNRIITYLQVRSTQCVALSEPVAIKSLVF